MKPLRRIAAFFALALALALGQQAGLLHALGHASERVAQTQDGKPASLPCEHCALVAQLDGMASEAPSPLAMPAALVAAIDFRPCEAPSRATVVFLSRAPPVLS